MLLEDLSDSVVSINDIIHMSYACVLLVFHRPPSRPIAADKRICYAVISLRRYVKFVFKIIGLKLLIKFIN